MTASLLYGMIYVVDLLINALVFLILISVAMSWLNPDPRNQAVYWIRRLSEYIYGPLRKYTVKIPGPIDWAPTIALLILVFIQKSVGFYLRHQLLSMP